ncbi:hypothetical protein CEUSTIGMA_g8533.t1 [Chlamydomonas eustigma]|uniref:ADP-ribosylglycohydrolase n=1 Tax=Chlamydomonas eustigma TaxID=1157962 RepID=A0A250XDW4_9CHLO|nr:hypothetical protein CEUSTIGMA_g8533.t1 [Chlamydomonas eustigma]|eukprot:GAX81099.1 hypothetical protein CEUSTIGMA_g8533.t1 [Chlamydomonas eustigma]
MGLHWVYDQDELGSKLKDTERINEPEFFPPVDSFYKHPQGEFTPYGHELMAHLNFLAEMAKQADKRDNIDGDALAKYLSVYFKTQTHQGHYLNKASKAVLQNVQEGKQYPETGHPSDAEAGAFAKAPALVAVFTGPQLISNMETAVKVVMKNEAAAQAGVAAAAILEKVVSGMSVKEAIRWSLQESSPLSQTCKSQIEEAMSVQVANFSTTVQNMGLSCGLPESLQLALLGAVIYQDYSRAIRINIVAGGDNASRSILLGALLAAQCGLGAIPEGWRAKTTHYAEAERLIDEILAAKAQKATVPVVTMAAL